MVARPSRGSTAAPPRCERPTTATTTTIRAGPSTPWRERFAAELRGIASDDSQGPAPAVVESFAVDNVGASASLVVVNPGWMQRVSDGICGDDCGCRTDLVRGIAGHEWSHVLEARCPSGAAGSRHERELDADRHAGRVLGRSGASPAPLLALLGAGSSEATTTHPAREHRIDAMLEGHREQHGSRGGAGGSARRGRAPDRHEDELMRTQPGPRGSRAAPAPEMP